MTLDPSHSPSNNPDHSQQLTLPGSLPASARNGMAGTIQEDMEHMGSLSQKSSPRLPPILLPPSVPGGTRPRSSDGRVSSLNLPKHTPHLPRQNTSHLSLLGPSRRRIMSHTHAVKSDQEMTESGKSTRQPDDGLLNFGMGDDYAMGPEDPEVLADVQRALKAKALREARSKSGTSTPSSLSSPMKAGSSDVRLSPNSLAPSPSPTFPITPPRPVGSGSTHVAMSSPSTPPRIMFPPYVHSPSRSLESISSESRSGRSPVPILVSLPDGSSYLDWSGALPQDIVPQKDRRFLGRTFSLTKRKGKERDRRRGTAGRHSVDFEGSQGDLHAAQLDDIRRDAKPETLSRADIVKEELGRRYNSLVIDKTTGKPTLDIMKVVKSPKIKDHLHTPWLAWSRQRVVSSQNANVWTITANAVDGFLQVTGRLPMNSSFALPSKPTNISSQHSHSPSHGLSSPFSSSLSSLNTSPNHNDGTRNDRRRLELNRSLSANPAIEGVASALPPISPTLYRSLSLTQAPTFIDLSPPSTSQPRRSTDAVIVPSPATPSFPNPTRSPRSSLDPGSRPQLASGQIPTEKDSFRKKVRLSLSGDRLPSTVESRTSTMSSLANLFSATQTTGTPAASSRLHLGVSNVLGMMRRSGEETREGQYGRSRSSASEERDSGRDGEATKSDDPARLDRQGKTLRPPMLDIRPRGKDTSNTSDSDLGGHLGGKFVRKFHRHDKHRAHSAGETTEDVRESISGSEQRLVDALATPGWTSKRGVRRPRASAFQDMGHEKLQELLRKQEEEEERLKEVYRAREVMLIETNDHNRRIARLLKAVGTSIREHETIQSDLAQAVGANYTPIPQEVMDAIGADPATALRHGRGWRAVEDSYQRFISQQDVLASYLSTLTATATSEPECSSDLGHLIQEAAQLWHGLQVKREDIDKKCAVVKPALDTTVAHMGELQKEYNNTQILVETDYPEQTRIADLEMIITESRSPRGWLEFAAFWIPEHVLEFIGGFIRFFGVPISEKFIRPFLWYFFRDRYYWKIYSTEPQPSERAWYTRLGYWMVILSILAWYTTA